MNKRGNYEFSYKEKDGKREYLEGKEIENIAGNIGGAGGTILKSTEGNIEDKTITLVDNRKGVTENLY